MRLIRVLRDKRGIALENAILFMMVIFTLTALLTGLTLLGHLQVSLEKATLINDVKVESIGLDFVSEVRKDGFDKTQFEAKVTDGTDYSCKVEAVGDGYTLTVFSESESTLLYVKVESGEITAWRYSTPSAESEN